MSRPKPRTVKGFRDLYADDLARRRDMIEKVRRVYESYGFAEIDTPAVEFVDCLGKFLPESFTPAGGIFAFRNPDVADDDAAGDPDSWVSLRYDLTAPLARLVSEMGEKLPRPFRRWQVGTVWRVEKPGLGRFREFTQVDFDSVGVASVAADAEACAILAEVFEALGFARGDYLVRVNDRKVMQGLLSACGVAGAESADDDDSLAAQVLRTVDKLDRLGIEGVRELLGPGRRDETTVWTEGCKLTAAQIARIEEFLTARGEGDSRTAVCDRLLELVAESEIGREGVEELRAIDAVLTTLGIGDDRVIFDPTVVRGLAYYTGPVFEGQVVREIRDEKGRPRQFGALMSGGRYDGLVERFTGQKAPATGASVGVDRTLEVLKLLEPRQGRPSTAEVLVTVMDKARLPDYFAMARELRGAGVRTELFLGGGRIGKQLKYADRIGVPLALIAGSDEFDKGEVQVKDLRLGAELSGTIEDRDEWRKGQPAQQSVPRAELVERITAMLGHHG